MKYEVPVCEMLVLGSDDIITTSVGFSKDEISGNIGGSTPAIGFGSTTNDAGSTGIAN